MKIPPITLRNVHLFLDFVMRRLLHELKEVKK